MAAAETDAMAAAETDAVTAAENDKTTMTVEREQGTKATEVREERGWKDDISWRHTWVKQSEYWNDPKWNRRRAFESPTWCETKDIRQIARKSSLALNLLGGRGRARAGGRRSTVEPSCN